MSSLKSNVLTVKAAIEKQRVGLYQIEGEKGLHLHIQGGGKASWRMRYRPSRGAERQWETMTGDAGYNDGQITLSAAADWAARLRDSLRGGVDPKVERARKRTEAAAAEVAAAAAAEVERRTIRHCFDQWLENRGNKSPLAPRTRAEYERIFKSHIEPHLKTAPIRTITFEQVQAALEKVRKATTDPEKGWRGVQANRTRSLLLSIFKYARKQRWITENIVELTDDLVQDVLDKKRSRPVSEPELRTLWAALGGLANQQSARIIRLSFILGRRVSELALAERREFTDGSRPTLTIPADREGNKSKLETLVPLPPMAARLIREAMAQGDGRFIFTSRHGMATSRHTPSQDLRALLDDRGIGENVRFHDARTFVNDGLTDLNVPTLIRSLVLGHSDAPEFGMLVNSGTYSTRLHLDRKHRALRTWELRLREIVRERKPRGLVYVEPAQRK